MKEVVPLTVSTGKYGGLNDFHFVDYNQIIPLLIGAVKHLGTRVADLENEAQSQEDDHDYAVI